MNELQRFVCDNCGFWQVHNATPSTCPVCTDFRHTPPPRPFRFLSPDEASREVVNEWDEIEPGVWEIRAEPKFGIGTVGYLLEHPEGNIFWDGVAWHTPGCLDFIESRGGLKWLCASHPHAFGAAWQLQERFEPTVAIQVRDLNWTGAFNTAWPFDESLELADGLQVLHTGGHFDGHSILHWRERGLLFAGDMLKFHADESPIGISCHKAFNRRVPVSHAEAKRYREVVTPLEFQTVYTSFERAACTRDDALALFDAQLGGPPFFGPIPLPSAASTSGAPTQ